MGPPPLQVAGATLEPVAAGLELSIAVTPREPGLTVAFLLPPGVTPARHNLPGVVRGGSWTATYIAVPDTGVVFRASFNTSDPAAVGRPLLVVSSARLPGGEGWQSLPAWLPQERAVWTATAAWAVPIRFAAAAPLR